MTQTIIFKKYKIFINFNSFISLTSFGHIYLIINNINKKKYVGQSINVRGRIVEHISNFRKKSPLYNAFRKYELLNFSFNIIDQASNVQELNEKEIYYIKEFNSTNKNFGYNIESGGKNAIPNKKTLLKMSKSHRGIVQNENWINNRIFKSGTDEAKKYGKIKTKEQKQELSKKNQKFWKGKVRDEETCKKISKTKIERGLSKKQVQLLCKTVYKINLINKSFQKFISTAEAGKNEKVDQSTISRWCRKNKVINNFLWSYSC